MHECVTVSYAYWSPGNSYTVLQEGAQSRAYPLATQAYTCRSQNRSCAARVNPPPVLPGCLLSNCDHITCDKTLNSPHFSVFSASQTAYPDALASVLGTDTTASLSCSEPEPCRMQSCNSCQQWLDVFYGVRASRLQTARKFNMLVVYGSETGNAQDVAELLAAHMKQAVSPDSCALPMDCVTLEELAKEDLVLFVCSTTGMIGCLLTCSIPARQKDCLEICATALMSTKRCTPARKPTYRINEASCYKCASMRGYVCCAGQGDVPQGMQHTWRSMLRKSLPPSMLAQTHYAVFGLGDSGYVQFNVIAKKLDKRLEQLGGRRLIDRGLGDDQVQHHTARWLLKCLCRANNCCLPVGAPASRMLIARCPLSTSSSLGSTLRVASPLRTHLRAAGLWWVRNSPRPMD